MTRPNNAPAVTVAQNDPSELLEVCDARGHLTGRGETRAHVHELGLWHRAFHCWIVRPGADGAPEVVLQRRALTKDTFPGCWDASSAGHWRVGETAAEAARELAEELGIDVPFAQLEWRGQERTSRSHANGLTDREFHQVYRLTWPAPLMSYRPDPREVSGVAAVRVRDLVGLVSGRVETAETTEAVAVEPDGTVRPTTVVLGRTSLVPYPLARVKRLLSQSSPALPAPA